MDILSQIWEFSNQWFTLPLSIFAGVFSIKNFMDASPKIELKQYEEANTALIEPDRISDDFDLPDRLWTKKYRIISDITIVNKSSKPITIIEMRLNDELVYNSYAYPGNEYRVTLENRKQQLSSGIQAYGKGKYLNYNLRGKWLDLMNDIPPNSAVRGYIFFSFNDKEKVKIGKNKLKIVTSRKTFKLNLSINQQFYSQLLPQEKFDQERYLREFDMLPSSR